MSSEAIRGGKYNTYTKVAVRNDFGETAIEIKLQHKYGDDGWSEFKWDNVATGTTGGPWSVGYNTGFGRTGTDHWAASVKLASGTWLTQRDHACQLTKDDADKYLVFSVGPSGSYGPGLSMNIPSGSCWQEMVFL